MQFANRRDGLTAGRDRIGDDEPDAAIRNLSPAGQSLRFFLAIGLPPSPRILLPRLETVT